MKAFFDTSLFHIVATITVYLLSSFLYNKFKYKIFHPGMISIASLILLLKITGAPFEDYEANTQMISFWLGPSVVALGLPLFLYIKHLKGSLIKVSVAMIGGSLLGIISAVVFGKIFGASDIILYSLAPKSVTTPIAMEISRGIGGIPSLTIAIVFITGFTGALFGWGFLRKIGVKDEKAVGISIGIASHGIGIAEIVKKGEKFGAYGALGMALNGILTSILAPIVTPQLVNFLNMIFS